MNTSKLIRRCRFLSVLLTAVLLLILAAVCTRTQIAANEKERLSTIARGTIYDADGNALAWSEAGKGERDYLNGEAGSALVGYVSRHHGSDGIERLYDDWLSPAGSDSEHGDIHLTVSSELIQICYDSLSAAPVGAAVMLDINTGAILSAVDTPSFDPEELDFDYDGVVSRGCVFYNIFASRNITAGPMFCIPSCGAAVSAGKAELADAILCGEVSSGDIIEGHSTVEDELRERMLVGQVIQLDSMTLRSGFEPEEGFSTGEDRKAAMLGYGSAQISPMQICMYTAAAAREDGSIIKPYAINKRVSREGETFFSAGSEVLSAGAFTGEAKALIDSALTVHNTQNSTFAAMTAKVVTGEIDNIWLTAYAPAADPTYALTIVMQEQHGRLGENDVLSAAEKIFNSIL